MSFGKTAFIIPFIPKNKLYKNLFVESVKHNISQLPVYKYQAAEADEDAHYLGCGYCFSVDQQADYEQAYCQSNVADNVSCVYVPSDAVHEYVARFKGYYYKTQHYCGPVYSRPLRNDISSVA